MKSLHAQACGVGCVGEQTKRRPASCVINPLAGRELEFEEQPAAEEKKILVVGAGIAGLAAARILAKRGHHVVVFGRKRTKSRRSVESGMPRSV